MAYLLPFGGKVASLQSILINSDSVRFSGNTFAGIISDFV